jgi:ABC-type uncharacterized transport system auxiliary subunit
MKLRILGDSLRLRLSQSDVKTFAETGRVEEVIHFGPGAQITYALEHDAGVEALQASYAGSEVTVRMPTSVARGWADTDEVTLKADQALEGDATLSLLVEKDFKCAIPRPGEEDYDGFEHPTGGC